MEKQRCREEIESLLTGEMERVFAAVPQAREFHAGRAMDIAYYRRHLVETILRIRLNTQVQAYSLYMFGGRDGSLAKKLMRCLNEEHGQEQMFLLDVQRFGISREEALSSQPFFATDLLIAYLYHATRADGPLPTVVWSWFVEWYSDRYYEPIVTKAEEIFGAEWVFGARVQMAFDRREEHVERKFSMVMDVVEDEADLEKVKRYLCRFVRLVGMYFRELHESTSGAKSAPDSLSLLGAGQ